MIFGLSFAHVCEATTSYIIVHLIVKGLLYLLKSGERSAVILMHYQHRTLGNGHGTDSVVDCRQDRCVAFG